MPLPRRKSDGTIMRRPQDNGPLSSVAKIPAYAVIIRAIHERGEVQDEAVAELRARGLWLTEDQKRQANLPTKQL